MSHERVIVCGAERPRLLRADHITEINAVFSPSEGTWSVVAELYNGKSRALAEGLDGAEANALFAYIAKWFSFRGGLCCHVPEWRAEYRQLEEARHAANFGRSVPRFRRRAT